MISVVSPARIRAAYERARDDLLAQRNERGHWTGELSTSALSTATAVMALEMVRRGSIPDAEQLTFLINGGLAWLAAQQNEDGGWGDTTKSFSNISTTMLAHAAFHVKRSEWAVPGATAVSAVSNGDAHTDAGTAETAVAHEYENIVKRATAYIDNAGGVPAVVARYGKDKTFSVPILTHCALAGLVDWREVQQLPFELACLPSRFYKTVRLPVVSYALPALIAIGQVRHHFRPTRVPGLRQLRTASRRRSLDVLERIQPSNGGFLEAAPLTSFVTMSLAGMGLVDHPVVRKGVEFLVDSVREDGSWPIDTNLATWVTTLSVNALGPDLPDEAREPILRWLLDQQYKEVHPFTGADPGGWSWTDLPGGVPDADDTPGVILAILELVRGRDPRDSAQNQTPLLTPTVREGSERQSTPDTSLTVGASVSSPLPEQLVAEAHEAVRRGVTWLLDLQNRDGGWPTFCRGWGTLPFDRSSPDITAHVIRALMASTDAYDREIWGRISWVNESDLIQEEGRAFNAQNRAWRFFKRMHAADGSWEPLWFGNQHASDQTNRTYGTSKVLMAWRWIYCDGSMVLGERFEPKGPHRRALNWLLRVQNPDGGFGGDVHCPSSVEETALAVEVLLSDPSESSQVAAWRGLLWLIERVEDGTYREPTPIGFYFAKLWYFESLYPLIFTVAALRRAVGLYADSD
jgi:squalene-hopene/tetraprenyl-beta-curcumene cyclase